MSSIILAADKEGLLIPWGHPNGFPRLPMRAGPLKGRSSTMRARDDLEAVQAWLDNYRQYSKHTRDAYQREVHRFLLWCAYRGLGLTELSHEAFQEYREFLNAPYPEHLWISAGQQRYKRGHPGWRPYRKRPDESTIEYHWKIVRTLMGYLTRSGWLIENPMPEKMKFTAKGLDAVTRSLNRAQMNGIYDHLNERLKKTSNFRQRLTVRRDRWVTALTYYLALRESEVAEHYMNAFREDRSTRPYSWNVLVKGKGGKIITLPATKALIDEMVVFRTEIGLTPYPARDETVPLVPDTRYVKVHGHGAKLTLTNQTVSRMTVYRILKGVMKGASERLIESGEHEDGIRLAEATPHWLRHTRLKDLADSSKDVRLVQKMGRHANIQTSMGYAKADIEQLREALADLE